MALLGSAFLGLITLLVALLAPTVIHYSKIGGPFLTPKPTVLGQGQGPVVIEDTVHCEDVHHYRPANLLFTACEDEIKTRFDWFPGLGHLEAHAAGQGSIHVVDPKVSFCPCQTMLLYCAETHNGKPERIHNNMLFYSDYEIESFGI